MANMTAAIKSRAYGALISLSISVLCRQTLLAHPSTNRIRRRLTSLTAVLNLQARQPRTTTTSSVRIRPQTH